MFSVRPRSAGAMSRVLWTVATCVSTKERVVIDHQLDGSRHLTSPLAAVLLLVVVLNVESAA